MQENQRQTVEVVAGARSYGANVEGEIEAITGVEDGIGSDEVAKQQSLPVALEFIRKTGVDVFAPAIGNAHGVYHAEPHLDAQRVSDIVAAQPIPIALHGGTGMTDAQFTDLIARGCAKVNISTALKVTYMKANLSSCAGRRSATAGTPRPCSPRCGPPCWTWRPTTCAASAASAGPGERGMTSSPAPALVFDCDGVLADTERYGHLPAFNQTFAEFGLPVRWSVAEDCCHHHQPHRRHLWPHLGHSLPAGWHDGWRHRRAGTSADRRHAAGRRRGDQGPREIRRGRQDAARRPRPRGRHDR